MSIEYHLYRAKFIRPQQSSFLHDDATPTSLFLRSLGERPYTTFRKDYTWHIGNVTELEELSGYFAVGRNSPTSIPKLDPRTGDFGRMEGDTSPYTFVIFDAAIGLMAIKREAELASRTEDIATKIEKLLGQTSVIMENEISVKIDLIPDPEGFIAKLEGAHAIKKFCASFTGPNPFDADELFQRPLSVYLNAANGNSGSATIEGAQLKTDVVTAVARSTAASGNTASAKIQEHSGMRTIPIKLSGNPVKLAYDNDSVPQEQVLNDAREAYRKVRHEGD